MCISYIATGPTGTRYEDVTLRIVAYQLVGYPEKDKLKVVLQAIDETGPIVESPVAEGFKTPLELNAYLSESRREGWGIEQEVVDVA
jgi:hypothetical protein